MAEIRNVVVVGSGNMGSGIAQACSTAGYVTTMVDTKQEFLDKAVQRIRGPLDKRVAKGKMTQEQVDRILNGIAATTDLKAAAKDADLVIEAVFEEFDVKKGVLDQIAAVAKPTLIVATNTSSLSVARLAKAFGAPDRFGGLHFFNPAAVNKLVEVVRGDATSDETYRTLWDVALRLGKVPIETADSAGFCVNRFFVPFLNEANRLLEEGVADAVTIDAAANELLGTGMGPCQLMNFTGVPIAYHSEETLHQAFGAYYKPADLLQQKFESKAPYDLDGSPDPSKFDAVKARFMGQLFGIAAQLVDEGVATIEATEKGALLGLRWAQGPFALMNKVGTKVALKHVQALHEKWGDAFPVAKNLQEVAARGAAWPIRTVTVARQGRVAVVTIDRPEALNALNPKVLGDLEAALEEVEADKDVRAVVLTGSGSAFVAGADIKTMVTLGAVESLAYTQQGQRVVRRLETMQKPVVGAVNGYALGGGCELALGCDLLIASEKATFALPEVSLGIHPGFGGTQRLPRLVGPNRAKELIFTGETFTARDAERIGLVNKVVAPADLLPEALRIAGRIAEMAPVAIGLAKGAVNQGLQSDLGSGLALEVNSVSLTFDTKDQKEGMRAFLERRKPDFQGR